MTNLVPISLTVLVVLILALTGARHLRRFLDNRRRARLHAEIHQVADDQAQQSAKELVLSEWQPGGEYASANAGPLPALVVEDSWSVGLLSGIFGRRPCGYSYFKRED